MIQVDGVSLLTGMYQVLQTLQHELRSQGIPFLATVRYTGEGQDIQISCPYHKGGQEHRPSCGVTAREKKGIPAGTVHCFSCNTTSYITEMISHCFGRQDGGIFGKKWLLDRFAILDSEHRKGIFNVPKREHKADFVQFIEPYELESYRWIHPYLYKRGMTDELIEMFDLGYDKALQAVTFPIKDILGNVLFVAKRSVKTKKFYLPKDLDKPLCYLYEAKKYYPDSKELYICESLFNSLTCFKFGMPAVSLLGTGSNNQIKQLQGLDYRRYIICTDSDEAGKKSRKKLKKALDKSAFIDYIIPSEGKDLNDYVFSKDKEEFLMRSGCLCARQDKAKSI